MYCSLVTPRPTDLQNALQPIKPPDPPAHPLYSPTLVDIVKTSLECGLERDQPSSI